MDAGLYGLIGKQRRDEGLRRDFPKFRVEAVYLAQDGCCLRCGNSLERGFHRHHKDGNAANNSIDNLELICPSCHRATFEGGFKQHEDQERKVLDQLNRLIDEAFAGKMAGTVIERLLDAITLALKVSRKINKVDEGIESVPPSLAILRRLEESKLLMEMYVKGFVDGMRGKYDLERIEDEA